MLLTVAMPGFAYAEEPAHCPPESVQLDKHRYLRALSLDLRGVAPTLAEHDTLEANADVAEATLTAYLDSPEFPKQVARYHRNIFWNRVTDTELLHEDAMIGTVTYYNMGVSPALYARHRANLLRGAQYVPCLDTPATFDPETGEIQVTLDPETGALQEGWVEVTPYWAPGTPVKVCAFDAQATLKAPDGTSCKGRVGLTRPECGCGPELKWCATNESATAMRDALGVSVDVVVERLIAEDRPYTDLFLKNVAYFNGPLAHYWTHLAQRYDLYPANSNIVPLGLISDIPYGDVDVWKAVELAPQHAGVLTSPVYLMRFTSNRRRGRRYIEALLNQPFVPPAGGLDIDSEASPEPDTTAKDGCKYCHAILEPAAEHWGRWTEFAMQYLPPESYPPCRADCQLCAYTGGCSEDCTANYVTQGALTKETLYYGWLKPYQFNVEGALLDEIAAEAEATKVQCEPGLVAQAELDHIELGPKNFVKMTIVDGRLARGTVKNTLRWLIGTDRHPGDAEWIETLAKDFAQSGYDYKALVRKIVSHDRYRRVQ